MVKPDSPDTRARVVAAALCEFAEHGFDGTSLQAIADRVGLTKAALYYHFPTKDELLVDVAAEAFDDLDALLTRFETVRPTASTRRDAVASYLDLLLTHRTLIGFLTRDLGVLSHPAVGPRGRALQIRIDSVMLGRTHDPADRIRATMAVSGMTGAVAASEGVPLDLFRDTVLRTTEAVLRSRGRTTSVA